MSTSDYLSAINFGTSTGGAAGSSEDSTTLGTARLDRQVPPSQYQVSGLQITRLVEAVTAISSYLKGGTRVRVLKQSSNPFGASESGFYINTSGTAYVVVDGTPTAIGGGGGSGDMVLASTQTVTGAKTFNSATLLVNNAGNTFASTLASGATAARTWTLPDATDTAVGLAATQTLTNKTLTAPVIDSIAATAATGKTYTAAVADSGTNVAHIFNNSTALSGTTLLASFRNNSVEKLSIADDGALASPGTFTATGTDISLLNSGSSGFVTSSGGGSISLRYAGNDILSVNGGGAYPGADVTKFLGTPGNRFQYAAVGYYETKMGAQLTAATSITPTTGLHHVTGATTITTISASNFPAGNAELTLVADGGTITLSTGGNIGASVTIAQNKAQRFVYDSSGTTWYPVQ